MSTGVQPGGGHGAWSATAGAGGPAWVLLPGARPGRGPAGGRRALRGGSGAAPGAGSAAGRTRAAGGVRASGPGSGGGRRGRVQPVTLPVERIGRQVGRAGAGRQRRGPVHRDAVDVRGGQRVQELGPVAVVAGEGADRGGGGGWPG